MSISAAVQANNLDVVVSGGFPRRVSKKILHDLNFSVQPGQITGLLGPSGGGKTTLMRAIVGVQAYAGSLEVFGQSAGDTSLRGRIGYVTQSASVYEDLSVIDNLKYFASLARANSSPARDPEEIFSILDIADLKHQQVSTLSGGQRGRVSLGCALIATPDLLVMDEPTVGLDPITRQALWKEFRSIAQGGAGVIISSHVLDEASRCDNLLLLREGRIVWTGTPKQLLAETQQNSYEDAFLAAIDEAQR